MDAAFKNVAFVCFGPPFSHIRPSEMHDNIDIVECTSIEASTGRIPNEGLAIGVVMAEATQGPDMMASLFKRPLQRGANQAGRTSDKPSLTFHSYIM